MCILNLYNETTITGNVGLPSVVQTCSVFRAKYITIITGN